MSPGPRVSILHLITKLPIGGAQDNTLLSVAGLPRAAYRVDIASAPGDAWAPRALAVADRVHWLPNLQRDMAPTADVRALVDIARLLRRERYAVLHTHSSKAGLLGRIAARLAGTPVVIHTVHGFAFNDLTFGPLTRRCYLWLERVGARLSDHLVLVSTLNRQEALEQGIGSAESMSVIYSGIDLTRFQSPPSAAAVRRRLAIPDHHQVVGTVGRLASCNAPLLFVDAAHRLLADRPDVTVLIVGDSKWRPQVAAAIGDEPRIRLLGNRDDIPDILAALDVFVSSNMWAGLGRAVTEAMAAGLPVVAFPVNGVPELVQHGVTGRHAAVGDPADLARQTAALLRDPAQATALGAAARRLVSAHWSADAMVAALDTLYRAQLSARGIRVPAAPALTPALYG